MKSAGEVIALLPPGQTLFVAGYSGHPHELADALVKAAPGVQPIRIITAVMLSDGSPLSAWPASSLDRVDLLYAGTAMRDGFKAGWADYFPVHLSQVPQQLVSGKLPLDAVCIQVSPPDAEGRCHFGLSVDVLPEAVSVAKKVLAQVNPNLPRPRGAGWVHASRIDAWFEVNEALPDHSRHRMSPTDQAIGEHVAELVPDNATLQFGFGGVMDRAAHALLGRRGLGIHSSVLTDGVMRLMREGAVTNRNKGLDPDRSVATMAVGSPELYRFIDDNPAVSLEPVSYTHSPRTLGKLNRLVAINSAFEVDLSGAANAEVVGSGLAGAVGGQLDFGRAARSSADGRSILALPSTAGGGAKSRIVPYLGRGVPVTTPRSDIEWVVTEYGAVDVSALSLRDRAEALIGIAHPSHRKALATSLQQRKDRYGTLPGPSGCGFSK